MNLTPGPWAKITFSAVSAIAAIILPRPHASAAAVAVTPDPGTLDRPPHTVVRAVTTLVRASRLYTVISGDSISAAAVKDCHGHAEDWTGIYAESRREHLTGVNANQVSIGQHLAVSCIYLPSQLRYAPAMTPPPVPQAAVAASSASPVRHYHRAVVSYSGNVSPSGYGGYQQCVISRESGGNSQVMNSSGHYGLYQFSESTWQAYGGSSGTFGHASVAEQNRIFGNAMAQGGQSNWSPYDGC
jgi:hypothetical protein